MQPAETPANLKGMKILTTLCALVFLAEIATASVRPTGTRHEVAGTKTGRYISEGFFIGGSRKVTSAKLQDIRLGKDQKGFERVVLDLNTSDGNPYFQVQANPNENRMIVSIWADVTYDFDATKVRKAFAKSTKIKRVNVVPRVEDGLTVLEFQLAPQKVKYEVFHLANPTRIIMDIL